MRIRERTRRGVLCALAALAGLAAVLALAERAPAAPHELHVAPGGNDAGPGTLAQPYETLHRAQQEVRSLTAAMTDDIVVQVHPGTFTLAEPLRMRGWEGDSGQNGHEVIWQGYGEGESIVSGGSTITGWALADPETGIWSADVGNLQTRQLFVDGERAKRTDFGAQLPGEWEMTKDGYVTDSLVPQSWERPEDMEITFEGWFSEAICGIKDIEGDETSSTILMDQPCFRWTRQLVSGTIEGFPPLDLSYFEPHPHNSPSFLTEPGTFYLDRSVPGEHVLYYLPRSGEVMATADVVAPVLETLVSGRSLHDVEIRDLTFSHATWLKPNRPSGFIQVYGPIYENGPTPPENAPFVLSEHSRTVPGNVSFRKSERIAIEDNHFTRLGSQALELSLESHENVVQGNVFDDLSGGAIEVGNAHPYTDDDLVNEDNLVTNNWVTDIGLDYPGAVAIIAETTQRTTIAHNQVNDVPYSGIVFGQDRPTIGAQILNNKVFDTINVLNDGGAIYGAGNQGTSYEDGANVEGNWVFRNPGGIGLYTDDYSRYVTVRDNVTYRNGIGAYGGCLEIKDVTLTQNYWDDPEGIWGCGELDESVVVTENETLPKPKPGAACRAIPDCKAIMDGAGLTPAYKHLLE